MHFTNLQFLYFQYYDETFPTTKEQKAFEKNLFNKTHRANGKHLHIVIRVLEDQFQIVKGRLYGYKFWIKMEQAHI